MATLARSKRRCVSLKLAARRANLKAQEFKVQVLVQVVADVHVCTYVILPFIMTRIVAMRSARRSPLVSNRYNDKY